MADPVVLVTGATGQLGPALVESLLTQGARVIAVVRTPGGEAVLRRRVASATTLPRGELARLSIVHGTLEDLPGNDAGPAGWPVDIGAVTHVVHCAAVTRFSVDGEAADRVNVEGTSGLLRLASRCPQLERFTFLSTLYTAGLVEGEIAEAPHAGERAFANHYERSKHEAERRVLASGLPWQILRVGTSLADDESGEVLTFGALHNTLALFFHGLLSVAPGAPGTPIPLVTSSWVAGAVVRAAFTGPADLVAHLVHHPDRALTLGALLDRALARFRADQSFAARGIGSPLLADPDTFDLYAEAGDSFGGAVVRQAAASLRPVARQLFAPKRFLTDERARLGIEEPTDPSLLFARTLEHLVSRRLRVPRLAA